MPNSAKRARDRWLAKKGKDFTPPKKKRKKKKLAK